MKLQRLTPILFFVSMLFFVGGNTFLPLTDPVESNYALTAKEMVESGNWLSPQIYGQFWYDKPIMIYWLIALCYKIFGIVDWAARLPSAFFGALSVATLYQVIASSSGRWLIGLISATIMGTSLMFWAVAHGIITDMVLLYMTLGTMVYAYKGMVMGTKYGMTIAYVFAALGVLTKGPVAIVLPGLILLIYAGLIMRSWTMVKRIFDWKGIVLFFAVAAPWYIYMYSTHGQAFIDGFLGLHNVTRATQSEHPEDNHWWYYIAIFLGAQLPWTGVIIYGMVKGWKRQHPGYLYNMVWGIGTVVFYTLMATKYPLYTFISLIPFSILGAIGVMKCIRPGLPRRYGWIIAGPTILLWIAYCVGSFFVPWGFWLLLYVLVVMLIIGLVYALYNNNRYMMPALAAVGTLLVSALVINEGIGPLVVQRSAVMITPIVDQFNGKVYYYDGYSTSLVFYTGKDVVKINAESHIPDKKIKRSAEWDKKYLMEQVDEQAFMKAMERGEQMMLIVGKRNVPNFEASPIFGKVTLFSVEGANHVYIINGKTSISGTN
ncbi:glycosyltransferase family 39 protein [Veillonella sp.]|jgi:4-amino-4-deoxy-L-arabinose transferase-like glycosyltransferase|uniref:ArnT family glycosyltransferase n=1 Tax=Veillonella sp. TaxID=1926307 RepID=UPI001B521D49|nr:glycosyltransferase family 39 protein [Veillonella sp.]MBP9516705.1 glycosyltransferase family 39 protein [Veillonella sp.]MBP9550529.1 glycosyltransferase family 39 protein [Veillonella sp.]